MVTITDNGIGLPKIIPRQKGMGLRIMQSRAGMIGGTLEVENCPSGGAKVVCSVSRKAIDKQKVKNRARETKE